MKREIKRIIEMFKNDHCQISACKVEKEVIGLELKVRRYKRAIKIMEAEENGKYHRIITEAMERASKEIG